MTGLPPIVLTARKLRKKMSLPETMLWQQLRLRPGGVKFRGQHGIGDYVLDFYCASARIGIEIDGHAHDCADRPARDKYRDAWLAEHGIRSISIAAERVLAEPLATAERLGTFASVRPVGPPLHREDAVPLTEDGEDLSGPRRRSTSWNT